MGGVNHSKIKVDRLISNVLGFLLSVGVWSFRLISILSGSRYHRHKKHLPRREGGVERMGVNSSSPAMKNKITKKKKILNLFWTFLKEKSERKKINLDITDREIDASDSFLFVPTTLIIKDHIQWNRGKKKRNKRKFKWFFC